VIPKEQDAEFVARMEDVLEVYERPLDPKRPVVCMDERPVQFVKETRTPIAMRRGRPRRYDYEYERAGTGCVFLFTNPLGGWRRTSVRPRRAAADWAEQMRVLLEEDYPEAETILLICDNLNTHKVSAFYKTFPPEKARELARRIEFHFTPAHGSWLNIAECELAVLSKQCLKDRVPNLSALKRRVTAWTKERNKRQRGVDWHFTTKDARTKLRRLYPEIQLS
jgi:hypothetical protein